MKEAGSSETLLEHYNIVPSCTLYVKYSITGTADRCLHATAQNINSNCKIQYKEYI
jgi:hypothetical protein